MEGKAARFKEFAGVDAFDIKINVELIDRWSRPAPRLKPAFGGTNLEDSPARLELAPSRRSIAARATARSQPRSPSRLS
ncbi:hypothetical protein AC629_08175 [Bradyrhizobium sp. NAS80.1]|nr:hypothetical protein AC630_03475 [Bradyrhizobium sp. AS23.2]OKO88836.1 hypothetical protein AC629_08175 [Bradyrhizobium sp. NAS80.1]